MEKKPLFHYFEAILPKERIQFDEENLLRCASDHTEDFVFKPQLVLQPITTEEVSKILSYCNKNKIIITPRGAGTGLSGGALPIKGGVCLDMKRMNQILEIDTDNFQVTTEPGVITQNLMDAVAERGLFYPVDPASKGSCFIGGNVAENSGGTRAVKYGTVKDYVLNLEVVLPNGQVMWTGANTLKNATGYDLTRLIVGSEGTLAVITKIVLRLLPLPKMNLLTFVPFKSIKEACQGVNQVFLSGYNPSTLEFIERVAIEISQDFVGDYPIQLPSGFEAGLMIEVNGNQEEQLLDEMEGIIDCLGEYEIGEAMMMTDTVSKERIWKIRRSMGEAAKGSSIYKEEDMVVPRAKLPELMKKVKELGTTYRFESVCYGHAGDGNLHINILKKEMSDEDWNQKLPIAMRELFEYVVSLKGTLSGEHGIGYVQKEFMDIPFSETALQIMRQIKQLFDPNHILNPGKILPGNMEN